MGRENPWYHPNCALRHLSTPLTRDTPQLIAAGLRVGSPFAALGRFLSARFFRKTLSFAAQTKASTLHRLCIQLQNDYKLPLPECQEQRIRKGSFIPNSLYSTGSASAIS